jgi:acetyltransferase-like isoleucine patch superfamily enzyme
MIRSFLFRALNKSIMIWHRVKTRCWYALFFDSIGRKTTLLNPLFIANPDRISIGSKVLIRDHARLEVVGSGHIRIGDNSSFEQSLHVTSGGELLIGNNVTVSFGSMITNIDHEYQEIGVHILNQPYLIQPTRIGDNCFIGAGVKIQAGTVLGKQCVVGSNAVVRGDYPDYCVLVGVPARVIKRYNIESQRWEKTQPDGSFR